MRVLVSVVCSLIAILIDAVPTLAQSDEIFLSLSNPSTGFGDRTPSQKDAAFYRSFAKPVRDQPQQSSVAGVWTLETDTRTKIAYPRVVRLASNRPVAHVNDALAAIHGRMIGWTLENDRMVAENWLASEWPPGSSIINSTVKVTYFSANYLSIVELGMAQGGGIRQSPFARGVTVDIERGTISGVRDCGSDPKRPMFAFGSLLVVCTESSLATFRDLWRAQAETLVADVPWGLLSRDDELEVCRLRTLAYIDRDVFFRFT